MNFKKYDLYNAYLIIVTGVLQCIAAPLFFKSLEEPAFWFFNGGTTLMLLGYLNVLRINYGTKIRSIRKLSIFANFFVLVFWLSMLYCLFYKFQRYPMAFIELVILAAAFLFSLKEQE
ncbi:hypothetical protein [Cellulosilyticum sp. I15G10I2]|uniref:hypothetical protein n=1 Tax=Cellulosilyticum sp. I15G10I2 TaxID=1892843 RepID=UPI00085C5E7F|nr:hypothetical protein [Cellulosilyticum sp. I15G10I2]